MSTGSYRFRVGAFEAIALVDCVRPMMPTAPFFVNAQPRRLEQAYREHGVQGEQYTAFVVCLTLNTGRQRILVDTGVGAGSDPTSGMLGKQLQAAQVAPQDIDLVILTHWHFDHVWGLVGADGKLAFPQARYAMWNDEWAWATDEANVSLMQAVGGERCRASLLAIRNHLLPIDDETEIVPGIQAIAAPGHTVGHIGLLVSSEGERLLCIGDIAHHPIHLAHPEWHSVFDSAPEQAIATRRALLGRASDEQTLVFSPHLPPYGVGYVAKNGNAWLWQPAGS